MQTGTSPPSPQGVINGIAQTSPRNYTYYKQIFRNHSMPFAFLDLDLLDLNIAAIAASAGQKKIRLASKSIRSVGVLRHIFTASDQFQGIMCFTAREAVWLASQGFNDLLIGYPAWHAEAITAVAQSIANGSQITLMVDSVEHVTHIATIAAHHAVRIPVCVEIDMSLDIPGLHFGVWRSPLRTAEQARPVLEQITASPQLVLDGIMGYEAQIAGIGDQFPGQAFKNQIVRLLKHRSILMIARRRQSIIDLVASFGQSLRFVNGGGTGSLATTRAEQGVTEITVGSGFYSPGLFDNYRDFRFLPAVGYAVEIVRQPRPDLFICLGGGYVASGAVGLEKLPKPLLPAGAQLLPLEGAGEVQTPIRYTGPEHLQLGDPIFLRHSKAGEVCEHFTHLALVSHGAIVEEITTYRGDGQLFL